jgi:hypothetical protein
MSRTLWKVAGAFALGYVVLTLVGVSVGSKVPGLGAARGDVVADYTTAPQQRMLLATYISGLAVLAFIGLTAFLSRGLSVTSGSGWAAPATITAGAVFAVVFGLDPMLLAALTYAGHHGADPGALVLVDTVRNVVLLASYLALGTFTLVVALMIGTGRMLPRWLAWMGLLSGLVLFVPPLAGIAYLLSLAWIVALGVAMLTRRRDPVPVSAEPIRA